jgi:hypothetical protein
MLALMTSEEKPLMGPSIVIINGKAISSLMAAKTLGLGRES